MLCAAHELMLERGVDAVSIDEVARRSGVAKTTIYRHFASGDELIMTALAEMIQAVPSPDTGTLRGDLRVTIEGFLAIARDERNRHLFVSLLNRANTDPQFRPLHRELLDQRLAPFRAALRRAVERGEVDESVDLELMVTLVQGPFVALRVIENESISDEQIDGLLDLIVRALAPRS